MSQLFQFLKSLKEIWPILVFIVFIISSWVKWDIDIKSLKEDTNWIVHRISAENKGRKKVFREIRNDIKHLEAEVTKLKSP